MKKIILYGIGNDQIRKFNHYTFEKSKKVHKILSKLFNEFFDVKWALEKESYDEEDNCKIEEINIEKYGDFHQVIGGDFGKGRKARIDIFYGKNRMFVTIHCSQEKRRGFNEKLMKITEMPKPKKLNSEKTTQLK